MSHILITGAGGFVGSMLARQVLDAGSPFVQTLTRLTAIDQSLNAGNAPWLYDARVRGLTGSFGDPAILAQAMDEPVDVVFHLASVPGSLAERDQELGKRVNLWATLDFFHHLARQTASKGHQPPVRVVFASSVAVYGKLDSVLPVTEATPARPELSYGAHKLMAEILLADLSRRGDLDGISLRLPGIVARPLSPTGHGSAFMSDMIRRLRGGEAYECPVSAQAQAWWMSLRCSIHNLVRAARLDSCLLSASRTVQLPALTATIAQVVNTLELLAPGCSSKLSYSPNPDIEHIFGRYPVLDTPHARALGFTDDGSLLQLVQHAMLT